MASTSTADVIESIHSILHEKIIKFHQIKKLNASSAHDLKCESSLMIPSSESGEFTLENRGKTMLTDSNNRNLLQLDDDSILKIFEYLDEQNFSSVCVSSKAFLRLSNQFFTHILSRFHPYFSFNQRWMNRIVLKLLKFYFDNLESELNCDNLECANYNFSIEYKITESTGLKSFSIKYLIFSFINEIYYGTDKFSLTSIMAWKDNFIRKSMENDMPKCFKLYSEKFRRNGEIILQKLDELFNFFKTKPDYFTLLNFYRDYVVPNHRQFWFYAPEIDLAFRSLLFKDIVPDKSIFLNSLCCNSLLFKYIIDRFNPSEISEEIKLVLLKTLETEDINIEAVRAICTAVGSDEMDYLRYLWTRNASNPFNLDKFLTLKNLNIRKAITDVASVTDPSLVQIEIFKQLIRNINNSPNSADNFQVIRRSGKDSLMSTICACSTLLFAIFMKEVTFPINMFELDQISDVYKCSFNFKYNFDNQALKKRDKLEIFIIKLRQSTNIPLPLLFIHFELLTNPNIRHLLTDYFDLDRKYIFDASFNDVIIEGISRNTLAQLKGKSLNFRELIGLFGNITLTQKRDLISILSSKPKKNNKSSILEWIENVTKVESRKPISIFKFIFYGIFEEVDEKISELEIQSNINVMTYFK